MTPAAHNLGGDTREKLAIVEPKLDAWLDEPDQCRPCHGPIVPKTRLGMIRDYACYKLVLWWPERFFMRGGMRHILPFAGNHAFSCTCWSKIAAVAKVQP